MKRLIYAPKAYIFVRSSNLDGRVYDVSSDIVSGSVTQNCNDVSTANFYLRNRYQKWLRDPSSGNRSIFLPMDMVTIWLQRVAGKPIQVFTGYLDSVTYYQGYPNNAHFEASCTLKKLAYTWFDPGLPFFQQWMMSTDGWTYDVSTGEAINPQFQLTGTPITGAGPGNGTTATLNDGGFAALLGRFMTEVAGWSADDVLISELPSDIPKLAAKLYANIEQQTEADLSSLSNFMAQALGVSGWGANDQQITAGGAAVQPSVAIQIVSEIASVSSQSNVPSLVCVFAAYVLSGLTSNRAVGPGQATDDNWGYGLYSLQPASGTGANPLTSGSPISSFTGSAGLIQGYTPQQLRDATTSTQVFCKLLNQHQGWWSVAAKNNNLDAVVQWIELAIGRDLPKDVDRTSSFDKAKQIATSSQIMVPSQSPSIEVNAAQLSFQDPTLQTLLTDKDKLVVDHYYSSSNFWLAGVLWRAKQVSKNLQLSTFNNQPPEGILITGSASDLKAFFTSLQGDDTIDLAQFKSGGTVTSMQKGVISWLSIPVPGITINSVYVTQSTQPASTAASTGGTDTSTTQTPAGGSTFEQMAAFSANAAFAANFSFPADYLLATNLTGDRSLMNDTSCLDAVKQFCQASLRAFRSLPDGRFLAFYPDYFGATRQPYWQIKNIEIIDFGIQLNDEALATHVYVVGDTFDGDGSIDDYDQISTRGVATLNQAFMLDSFIEPYVQPADNIGAITPPQLGRLQDAHQFLQHYGARPHMEEQPLIRNTFYEFLMAWQRFMQLWASQFATTATFTFQPEVMAGGLLAFPDHGIQMYCESTTHDFDYEGGFSTSAVLSSPSLLPGTQADRTWKPGFALAGNVNTVGLGGS